MASLWDRFTDAVIPKPKTSFKKHVGNNMSLGKDLLKASTGNDSAGLFGPPTKKPKPKASEKPRLGSYIIPKDTGQDMSDNSLGSELVSGLGSGLPGGGAINDLINELVNQSKSGFRWDGEAEEDAMLSKIFDEQLARISQTRNQTNDRFKESSANTASLYKGHENEVLGADRQRYTDIASQQTTRNNENFDGAIKDTQTMQNQNRSESEEMLKRLGLSASAPVAVEAANEQQSAIDQLVQTKAAQQQQNDAYAGADLRRNDERAQSIADEGVQQQTSLSRQLQDILGELGNKEADIHSEKASAKYGAYQNAQQNWRSDRDYATGALGGLMSSQEASADNAWQRQLQQQELQMKQAEMASKSQQETQGMNAPLMSNVLSGIGISDPAVQEQYSNAYTDAVMNADYTPGLDDQTSAYLKYLKKENPDLSASTLWAMVNGTLNYGTYKTGAPTS